MQTINHYKRRYEVTEDGKIWSNFSSMFIKLQIGKLGYHIVRLGTKKLGNKKTFYIHRLVAQAYISNPNNLPTVNHKNGIKTDNRVENLEWCTQKENVRHSWAIGTSKPRYNLDHPFTKISEDVVSEIRTKIDYKYGTMTKLAKEYGVSTSLISLIGKGYRNYA